MHNRCAKELKKEGSRIAGMDTFIERLKKARALNCNPSDIGIDSFICRQLSWDRAHSSTKI